MMRSVAIVGLVLACAACAAAPMTERERALDAIRRQIQYEQMAPRPGMVICTPIGAGSAVACY